MRGSTPRSFLPPNSQRSNQKSIDHNDASLAAHHSHLHRSETKLYDITPGESIVGSSKDDGDIPEEIRLENLPEISDSMKNQLSRVLGDLISAKAIDTTSHYMQEFHNDADHRWLTSYKNYHQEAFNAVFDDKEKDSRWTDWFEDMIQRDKLEIQVLMNPPKRSGEFNIKDVNGQQRDTSGIRLEYMHGLEPRKIANQVLVVRESIAKEVLIDLKCIRLENIEAVRFAKVKASQGEEEAVRTIKMTRSPTVGGSSTPLRDRTYHEISVILTNFAIEVVRQSITHDKASSEYLESYLKELSDEEEKRSVVERVLHEFAAPMELLEELYYRGISQGLASVTEDPNYKVNILKIAQQLLDTRYSLCLQANQMIIDDDNHSRTYYKKIKDAGGFKRFDMEKGEFRIVDLNAPEGSERAPTKLETVFDFSNPRSTKEEDDEAKKKEAAQSEALEKQDLTNSKPEAEGKAKVVVPLATISEDSTTVDFDRDSFGSSGPFLM
jgi:hypothetical protein